MTTPSSNDRLSLGFVGDICLSLGVIDVVRSHGGAFLFDGIRHLYDRFDLTTGNLECCIVNDESWSNSGWPPLDIPVDVANALLRSNIGVFCLANNHVLDRDAQGLSSTLDFLNRSGLSHFGAGHDIEAAEALLTVEVKGRRIAFIGAADMTAYHASRSGPGIAPLNARRLDRRIRAARRVADLVVVALHADLEFVSHPAPYRRRVSRRLIDNGAHIVVQHHPHVCQGIERYHDGLIAYSLGNHVFQVSDAGYQDRHEGTRDSMVLQVDVDFAEAHPRLDFTVHPLSIDENHRPVCPTAGQASRQQQRIMRLNRELEDAGAVRAAWRKTCWREVRTHVFDTYYAFRRSGFATALRDQIEMLRRSENRRWLYGFLSGGRY